MIFYQLSSPDLLNVGDGLEVAEEDLPQQRDVGDGEPQRVDLAQPLLVREGGHVPPQLLERGVDARAAEARGRG